MVILATDSAGSEPEAGSLVEEVPTGICSPSTPPAVSFPLNVTPTEFCECAYNCASGPLRNQPVPNSPVKAAFMRESTTKTHVNTTASVGFFSEIPGINQVPRRKAAMRE